MSDEVELLKNNAIDSIQLAIEQFNKPREGGRQQGVLMFLNNGLELLLKSAILYRGGSIWEDQDGHTIGFERCVNVAIYGERGAEDVKFLDEADRDPLRIINGLRDEATHYVLELSENQFYVHAKTGVTMADKILSEVFDERLADYLPVRVLPLSTQTPKDLQTLIDSEYRQIQELMETGATGRAGAKARSIEAIERALEEDVDSPTKDEIDGILSDITAGRDWTEVFPGVASLNFAAEGEGPTMTFKLTRSEGTPVRVVPEEEARGDEPVIAEREIDIRDRYSLGVHDVAGHLNLTWVKVWAVIRELEIHGDDEYHHKIPIGGSQKQDCYTDKVIDLIEDAVESGEIDPQEAYDRHWGS